LTKFDHYSEEEDIKQIFLFLFKISFFLFYGNFIFILVIVFCSGKNAKNSNKLVWR